MLRTPSGTDEPVNPGVPSVPTGSWRTIWPLGKDGLPRSTIQILPAGRTLPGNPLSLQLSRSGSLSRLILDDGFQE
ncbi:conserved hypothetical protein [Coccidioides posadasii str. Silveira]|uniref:Uncharacterized protein n=2 Tax=Coccidioides posadasii TaxID=199306 RepID=E9D1J8_COCPS|nr:conserved hypothetical protein [Coccidioides posadasii str. Silveira]KMM72127.1 hypothetical protein CPAG_08426 [Coccidioides posadasii RMSCC 3488]